MLYLFDKSEQFLRPILKAGVIEATMMEQIGAPAQLNVVLSSSADISNVFYIGHKDPVNTEFLRYYKVITTTWNQQGISVIAIETAFDDLSADGYIKDQRPQNKALALVLADILSGSRWSVGNVHATVSVTTNFYYVSRLEALQKLMEETGCEFKSRISFDGHAIVSRHIDVYIQSGENRGRRFVHGSNLLEVIKEENKLQIYTALIGFGKGEATIDGGFGRKITFADVEWKVTSGDPVDKPLDQEYVEIPSLTAAFGYPDGKPRIGMIDFPEVEDPVNLLEKTYEQLLETGRPKVYYQANVLDVGDTGLGDTVTVIRDDYNIRYQVRIIKRAVNLLQPKLVQIEFGDVPVGYTASQLISIKKKLDYQAEEYRSGYELILEQMTNLYWGEDGHNYDLPVGNEYGLPAGLYSFDKPIDESPTKWIYVGAGKIVISNEKNPDGTWKLKTIMDGDGLAAGIIATKHVSSEGIDASVIILSDSTTAQQAFDAAVTVFRDIPSPPYKQGDLWHMPELTVNYWLNCGLTVDQVMALGFTVEERMGGNSYVCVNNRASGNFARSDWKLTGTTDKTSAKLQQQLTTNTNTITEMGMQVTQVTEEVSQVAEDLENIELTPGPSAYEVAVAAGFTGTEEEWLASLVGDDGTTYYTWIKYADTPTTGMSDAPAGKDYVGIAHNKTTATESTNYDDYSWSKFKGEPGTDGDDGTGIASVIVEYVIGGTTEPTSGWTTTPPTTWGDDEYLWTRYKITYTDSTIVYTGANRLSDVEARRVLDAAKAYADQITPKVFRDIPQPPYKVGDLWNMPELTVDYWLICGLTVDQVIALNFTVEERMGGNSYVCTNARATGTFNHADWQLTGSTDKTMPQIERRITTNEAELTSLSLEISEVTEVVYEHSSEITTAKTNIAELTASSLTISENLEVGGVNLVTNPTFGTSQMAEKTGWSSEYVMQVLLDRFRGKTMNEMFATLAGKTVNDIMTYNF